MTRIKDAAGTSMFACRMGVVGKISKDLISHSNAGTIPGLFRERVRRSPNEIAYCAYDALAGGWQDLTWAEIARRTKICMGAVQELGLKRGDRVGLMMPNCRDWVAFDIAVMACGLITVPLYLHDSASNTAAILAHAGCTLLVVDKIDRWTGLENSFRSPGRLEAILVAGADGDVSAAAIEFDGGPRVCHFCKSRSDAKAAIYPDVPARPSDIATIIYTSGTTGIPKGVMLSHKAILWNAEAVTRFIAPLPSDTFLSCLPLAHAFERTLGHYLPMISGARVAYARSPETLADDFAGVRPTIFLGVPRIYERIAGRIKMAAGSAGFKRWLLELTARIGWRRFEAERDRVPRPGIGSRLIWPILQRLIASRVLTAFGGRLRIAVSGGASLPLDASQFLCGLGLPLVEGYGLTEAAPVVTATTLEDSLPGSVGRPLHGIDVRLDAHNELVIKTPSVMLGYWHDEAATRAVIDDNGWLHTGDIARIEDGRIFVQGRLKDIIVLSTGEKVAATHVEAAIAEDPVIEQVCVVGDGRPCLTAVVVPEPKAWLEFANEKGFDPANVDSDTAVRAVIARFRARSTHLPKPSQVRAVLVVREPWTVVNGILTPTLKVKRLAVEQRYATQIDSLFAALESRRPTGRVNAD